MQRIKVKRDNVTATHRLIEDRWPSDKPALAPGLTAYHKRGSIIVTPFEDNATAVLRPVETGCTVGHAQPVPGNVIEREVLSKDVSANRVAIGQWMIGPDEGHSKMRARCARSRLLRRGSRVRAATLSAAGHTP